MTDAQITAAAEAIAKRRAELLKWPPTAAVATQTDFEYARVALEAAEKAGA